VSNGSGGGNFGAGTIITLTASNAPSGKIFAGWTGLGINNTTSPTTTFIMPTNNALVTALFSNLPAPVFGNFQFAATTTNLTLTAQALVGQPWILQSSTNLSTWLDVATNYSAAGLVQFTNITSQLSSQLFFRIRSP
jgi:hypothetical protein